jgi:hypothetical protein
MMTLTQENKMINLQLYLIHYNNGAICTPCVLTRRLDSNAGTQAGVWSNREVELCESMIGGATCWFCAKIQGTKYQQMCAWLATTEMSGNMVTVRAGKSIVNA